ncbi:U-box domain-containing protein kinase family protein [Actinidia rufa]|uniref:RING-type E3 ubiquitin transferase n=1 Tax=Actinidia rufa TaxID=165716 RepID=A0A7J0H4I0_9ERIC|nr:U-box domain-containing protein kinase family protein [Actinidia rufa]
MELLSPTHPPLPPPEIVEEGGDRVHVAVGKSVDKAIALLRWSFERFGNREICILHVHQPSPLIPTLLGKLPASQASTEVVSAFRRDEKERTRKLLSNYLSICTQSKVRASVTVTEASHVQKGIVDLVNEHGIRKLVMGATPEKFDPQCYHNLSSLTNTTSSSGYTSSSDQRASSDSATKDDDEESLHDLLTEARIEAEASRDESFQEFLERKKLEAIGKINLASHRKIVSTPTAYGSVSSRRIGQRQGVAYHKMFIGHIVYRDGQARELQESVISLFKALESARAHEIKLREEAEDALKMTIQEQETLLEEKRRSATHNGVIGFSEDSLELAEFSLADLQIATCDFSESFKIGQSGYGSVYKGEMMDRTVAIKKLHPHNMQRQSEFLQEVQVLGKLQHPHLVTLIGACPEAWSLVYEYLPNGSLQDRLSRRSNSCSLTWKIRARIIAEVSSALLFLHSCKPEKIVHGNLKPENIVFDSEVSCKICDFGVRKLMPEETLRCPSFRWGTELKGSFSYTDPEFSRTRSLTPKSDIYSLGLIILQLLTGRDPVGLASEVRKAVSCGKLRSILDSSAGEWPNFVAKQLMDLGLKCCELNSRDRPELTPSLVRELEQLYTLEERPAPSFFLCPILQEIMHDPQVAADGFTYEGDALCTWLENGSETSPMTNLKLDHLHLTPNHALKHAIQDWFLKS